MAKIICIEASGAEHVIDAKPRLSLMENAVQNNVPGIVAECGGSCNCATCRVYVHEAWRQKIGEPSETELSMIEYSGDETPGIRLSCQINVSEELDGLIVRIPTSQY